jgi:hypothetical protein
LATLQISDVAHACRIPQPTTDNHGMAYFGAPDISPGSSADATGGAELIGQREVDPAIPGDPMVVDHPQPLR